MERGADKSNAASIAANFRGEVRRLRHCLVDRVEQIADIYFLGVIEDAFAQIENLKGRHWDSTVGGPHSAATLLH